MTQLRKALGGRTKRPPVEDVSKVTSRHSPFTSIPIGSLHDPVFRLFGDCPSHPYAAARGQFLWAVQAPAHRDSPERPLQTPRPDAPDNLPDPDAYFCPTLTEA